MQIDNDEARQSTGTVTAPPRRQASCASGPRLTLILLLVVFTMPVAGDPGNFTVSNLPKAPGYDNPVCFETNSGTLGQCSSATDGSCSVADDGRGNITISCPDGSSASFEVPSCGNSIVEGREACDDPDPAYCANDCATFNPFPGSTLVTAAQGRRINAWVRGPKTQKWARCYQMSVDGATAAAFHSACDNRGPTVTIALMNGGTANEVTIGGYSDVAFTSYGGFMGSSDTFLFSVTNDFRHSPIRSRQPDSGADGFVVDHADIGPGWGSSELDFITIYDSTACSLGRSYACRLPGYPQCQVDFCGAEFPDYFATDLEVWYAVD